MIIGLTGKAGVGKDLFSELIKKHLDSAESFAFAKPIKEAAKILFNFTDEQLYDQIKKEEIDIRWKKSPRQILQWLGTDILREHIDQDFFIKCIKQKIENSDKNFIIVTDVRFPNEAEFIRSMDGKVVKIIRPNAVTTEHNGHITEQGIADKLIDEIIINDGTIEDFENKIIEFLNGHKYIL